MHFIKNLKIRNKILLSFGLVLAMTVMLGLESLYFIERLAIIGDNYVEISLPATVELWKARRAILATEKAALETCLAETEEEIIKIEQELFDNRAVIEESLNDVLVYAPQFKEEVDNINTLLLDVTKYRDQILAESEKFTAEGNLNAYHIYHDKYVPAFDKVVEVVLDLDAQITAAINDRFMDAQGAKTSAFRITVGVFAFCIIATLALTLVLVKQLLPPIREIEAAMGFIENGELSKVKVTYESKDELGILSEAVRKTSNKLNIIIPDVVQIGRQLGDGNFVIQSQYRDEYIGDYQEILLSLRYIRDTLHSTLSKIDISSEEVLAGSQQVADGAQALSQGSTEQAAAVEELVATIADLSDKVRQNAENANTARTVANEAGLGVNESNEHMEQLLVAIDEIQNTSSQIEKIIKTIDDIAFQTNILALNAAVEAARAGAAGKGFAVVAEEVRNLAGKSAEAASSTTELIGNTVNAINKGTKLAKSTSESLVIVVDKVNIAGQKIDEIATASEEQSIAVGQISQGIDQISDVIQTNSATAQQSAAASEELNGQAEGLKELIKEFILN